MMPELTPQQKEALNYKSHISLTANAGSGKTFVLSKRFVEILLNEDIDLSNIVAITFTDKAAGELNRKIANEIDLRIFSEHKPERRYKLENLRRQLVTANISTIHSFCINILKEYAPEAGIDATFNVIDQQTADELIKLCAEDTINSLIKNQQHADDLKYLIRFFGSKKIFTTQLENSIHQRGIIKQLSNTLYSANESEVVNHLRKIFESTISQLFSTRIVSASTSLRKINDFVLHQSPSNKLAIDTEYILNQLSSSVVITEQINFLEQVKGKALTDKLGIRKQSYFGKGRENFGNDIDNVESLFTEVSAFFLLGNEKSEYELVRFAKTFLNIFDYTLNIYSGRKKQKSHLDFEDLLLYTQQLLKREEVRSYLCSKFRYIMIDEYQDTNELQYEIFMPLLDNLKEGNLFVVGDEKQSIYMFRNAELEIFSRTKNEISTVDNKGRLLNLPHSFRMSPKLVLFTNKLFSKLFEGTNQLFNEVEYSELICTRDDDRKGKIEILLADLDADARENDLVAQKIICLVKNSDVELRDIAILCRKRDSFTELEKVFVKYNIPYSIIGGKGFYQRQTIYDIYNYLSFLLNKENDAALIGIMRSPFFNLSDIQLYEISMKEGNSFFEKLENISRNNSQLKYVYEKLNDNLLIAFSSEIYSLIRKLLIECGYWAIIAAKQNASQEIANVEKILLLAREFSKKSFKNLYDFTVAMRESIEEQKDEGQAQITRDENTVKILTIHQAKGLEFKAVFLYACNDTVKDSSVKAKTLICDKRFGLITKVPVEGNYFSKYSTAPIAALYNYINQKKTAAEVKRLLYVGITRAIDYLFITASHKEFKPAKGSFFELITDGLKADYNQKEFLFSSKINFMKYDKDEYKFYDKTFSLDVSINDAVTLTAETSIKENIQPPTKEILTQTISDIPKREIISATKISMFTQCPVKYQLTYELGYSSINNLVKGRLNEYEFNSNEDDELRQYAQLRGKIIHALLSEEINIATIHHFIMMKLSLESFPDETMKQEFCDSIIKEIEEYYCSNTYSEISRYINYRNEFEIYCEEGEHYLYGIIDKLIIEKEKLIIVDYKTDKISREQLSERADSYIPQLTFYSYVLSKLYPEINSFMLQLIFLKHPNELITRMINRDDLNKFGNELQNSINKIYSSEFTPNLQHCSKCHFALERNKCIKPN